MIPFRMIDVSLAMKSLGVALLYMITVQGFFSVLVSIAAFFYFTAMLYHKIVKVHYHGRWSEFFKATFITFFKSIKMKTVKKLIANILEFATGYGFYGLGLLGIAAILLFLGREVWAFGFLCVFIGKNLQAIRESIGRIKF